MAKPQSIDELFPIGAPVEAGPSPAEVKAAAKPAFYPRAQEAAPAAPDPSSMDTMFPTGGPPEPTGGDIAGTIAKGAAAGALRDAPLVAGAMTGFRVGMPMAAAAAPFIGPAAGAIPLITTAIGGYTGYRAGQAAESVVPGETDPRLVPYREGGKTFGSSIATAPAAFFLPVAGPTAGRVAKFVSGVGETARRSPGVFAVTEGATAGAMGLAGGAAEAYRPGQEGVRFGAEMGAALLTPTKLLLSAVDLTKQGLATVKGAAGGRSAATEKKATNLLLDALNKTGEDPVALTKALRAQLPGTIPSPTAGQKTGSQALMDLEASLGNHRAQFGGESAQQGRNASLAYQALVEKLQEIGDPQALRVVAELQKKRFDSMIETRLSLADASAAAKIARITKDTPEARKQIGQLVKNETELALREARDVESQLWTAALEDLTKPVKSTVRRQVEVGWDRFRDKPIYKSFDEQVIQAPKLVPTATADSFLARASEMGPALFDEIPPQVRKIMESFGVDQEAVRKFRNGKLTDDYLNTGQVPQSFSPRIKEQPVQDLVNYRSTLLKMARDAAGTGDANKADFFSSMADGMMRDLDTLQDPMYAQARQFSRSLNDVFTRTYANTVGAVTKTGKDRVPPETLVVNAFSGNADQTAQRMKEIEDAVGFMRTQYREVVKKFGPDSPQALQLQPLARAATTNVASVRDAHNRVLRLAAANSLETVFDQAKGTYVQKVNLGKLTKFAQENAPMLEKMGIMGDLRDAAHASNLLTQVANENSALSKAAKNQSTFASLLTAESPTKVIAEGLNGRFPVRSINGLVDLAKKGGPDALDGLKASLFDYAYTKANGYSGKFSPDAYQTALFEPLGRNQPSLVNIMRSNGLMTLTEMSNVKKLLTPMVRIETALKNNIPYEDVIQGADAVTDLALRVAGAQIGTAAAPGGPGSLIAASAGSKAVRQIFDALPNATVRTILENATKDPQAMALLLEKGRTQQQQLDIANRLINYVGSLGVSIGKSAVTPALNYLSDPEARPAQATPTAPGDAARQLRQLPPAPTTRGVPGFSPKPGAQGKQGAAGGAPGDPNARSMMQSLFPFDSISAMASQPQQPPAPG
ncbi:hypothetical protein UFOVP652_7 [uncultured Caudovirales phage]|uniref:Uncharacterized protein n=1 Tax=uncultured Caudovirales phage TaxID=2100421 RepID=A0A6J7X9W6_9CAUD|nr:hypothetical protein UFOVP652_7 [uncultured Caudovirales phage]CAB5224166.1 hypothetical protein UFOVP734_32 [uncultured Caudovirales phage]